MRRRCSAAATGHAGGAREEVYASRDRRYARPSVLLRAGLQRPRAGVQPAERGLGGRGDDAEREQARRACRLGHRRLRLRPRPSTRRCRGNVVRRHPSAGLGAARRSRATRCSTPTPRRSPQPVPALDRLPLDHRRLRRHRRCAGRRDGAARPERAAQRAPRRRRTAWLGLWQRDRRCRCTSSASPASTARAAARSIRCGAARRGASTGRGHVFSRIHVDDIAAVLRASIAQPDPGPHLQRLRRRGGGAGRRRRLRLPPARRRAAAAGAVRGDGRADVGDGAQLLARQPARRQHAASSTNSGSACAIPPTAGPRRPRRRPSPEPGYRRTGRRCTTP